MLQPFELLDNARAKSPKGVGLVLEATELTFSDMWERSKRLAARFHSLGVRPRQVVSTFLPPGQDWLSTLAIFHEAAVPVSLWGVGPVANFDASWFVTEKYNGNSPKDKTVIVSFADNYVPPDEVGHRPRTLYARPDLPIRYVMTSGTTGEPKAVCFTGNTVEHRLQHLDKYWADCRPELNFMGLSTTGGFFSALAALQHGYPYLAETAVSPSSLKRATDYGIEVLAGSTSQIGHALAIIRDHKIRIPTLTEVRIAGSLPSVRLIGAIRSELGVAVKSVYGSTEGGGVATTYLEIGGNTSSLGKIIDGVEVSIDVDGDLSCQFPEGVGEIRYRGPGLAPSYLSTNQSDSSFRDSWFYPGDIGYFSEDGSLVLVGRVNEILNVSGTKVSPSALEDLAGKVSGVRDTAVCVIERIPGIEEIAIAVVADATFDTQALDQLLRAKFPTSHPTIFVKVDLLPRNRMGKIVRAEVKGQVLNALALK